MEAIKQEWKLRYYAMSRVCMNPLGEKQDSALGVLRHDFTIPWLCHYAATCTPLAQMRNALHYCRFTPEQVEAILENTTTECIRPEVTQNPIKVCGECSRMYMTAELRSCARCYEAVRKAVMRLPPKSLGGIRGLTMLSRAPNRRNWGRAWPKVHFQYINAMLRHGRFDLLDSTNSRFSPERYLKALDIPHDCWTALCLLEWATKGKPVKLSLQTLKMKIGRDEALLLAYRLSCMGDDFPIKVDFETASVSDKWRLGALGNWKTGSWEKSN